MCRPRNNNLAESRAPQTFKQGILMRLSEDTLVLEQRKCKGIMGSDTVRISTTVPYPFSEALLKP